MRHRSCCRRRSRNAAVTVTIRDFGAVKFYGQMSFLLLTNSTVILTGFHHPLRLVKGKGCLCFLRWLSDASVQTARLTSNDYHYRYYTAR